MQLEGFARISPRGYQQIPFDQGAEEKRMTKFYLIVNNGYSVQDNPEPKEWIRPIAAAGARYIEFFADHMDPLFARQVILRRSEYFQETMRVLRRHKVRAVSVGTGRLSYLGNVLSHPYPDMAEEGLRWCKAMVDLAAAMGARFIAGHYDYISQTDIRRSPERALERLLERLLRLAVYARRKGLEGICLEQMYTPHLKPYTVAEGQQMIGALNARSAVPFYMHCDTGHMAVGPAEDKKHTTKDKDPYFWLRQRWGGTKKLFVHLQQTDATGSRHWPFTPRCNRKGMVVADKVIEAIEDSGVEEAFLSFEILYPRGTPIKAITPDVVESVRHFERAFKRRGYRVKEGVCTKT
jgi:sugar phosphate isomerase/epimerase